jgi:hypothetical protein
MASILSLSIVYAATAGLLKFNGTAVISPNAKVVFSDVIDTGRAVDTFSISPDGQTMQFTVHLDAVKNNTAVITPKLHNSGVVPIILGTLVTSPPPKGISVVWPTNFDGLRLEPGEYSDNAEKITVTLTDSTLAPDSYTFSATISYTQSN